MSAAEARAAAMRAAMPFPLVRIVVDQSAIDRWRLATDTTSWANYEAMRAAGMIEVRDHRL